MSPRNSEPPHVAGGPAPIGLGTTGGPPPTFLRSPRSRIFGSQGSRLAASTGSSLVVVGVLAVLLFAAPGSAVFRNEFFNLHDMWQSLVGKPSAGYYSVGRGILVNIEIFLIAEVLILLVALGIALIRLSRSPVLFPFRVLAICYVDFFRGVPLILVLYGVGFGVPALRLGFISNQSAFVYGTFCLVVAYSAYVSEVYRAGIYSVPLGQVAAARSIGLRPRTAFRHVVLPQAVRTVIPALLNDFISLQKDTALVSILGSVFEALRSGEIYSSAVFNDSGITVAALLFLLLTIPMARFTDHVIARDRSRRLAGVMP